MDIPTMTGQSPADRRARLRGALAGFVPTIAIALLFAGGTSATPTEVAFSLILVALIAMSAGWIAGPLAAGRQRRLLVAALRYATWFIVASVVLSLIQAAWDTWVAKGVDPIAIAAAVLGRALVGIAGTAYLIIPAIALGLAWSVAARGLYVVDRFDEAAPIPSQ
jgi:hypothetical protein